MIPRNMGLQHASLSLLAQGETKDGKRKRQREEKTLHRQEKLTYFAENYTRWIKVKVYFWIQIYIFVQEKVQ